MNLPEHDVYACVVTGAPSMWVSAFYLDRDAITTIKDAADAIWERTSHVFRMNFRAGTIVDVSKEAAEQFLSDLRASLQRRPDEPLYFPPMVRRLCGDECDRIEEAWERREETDAAVLEEMRADRAAYQGKVR